MFKAVDTSRAWPSQGMTSDKWLDVPVQIVWVQDLIATQDGVYLDPIIRPGMPVGGDSYPHVVFWQGKYFLEDGHHRVMRLVIDGAVMIRARVLEIE